MKIFRRASVAAFALGLVLAGCSDPQPGPPTEAEQQPGGEEQPGAEEQPSTDPTADEESPQEEPAPEAAATGPQCLIGKWNLAADQMQAFFDSIEGPTEFSVVGNSGFEFTPEAYEYTPDLSLTVSISGMEGTGTMTGSITGSYTATDEVITTSNDINNIAMSMKIGPVTTDGTELGEGFLALSPINSATYECLADQLTIKWQNGGDGIDLDLVRVN